MKGTLRRRLRAVAMVLALALMIPLAPPALAEVFSAIVTASSMTVYYDAKLTTAIDSLPRNTVVRVTAYSGKAAQITWDEGSGYAKVADMKSVDSVADKAIVADGAKVYQTPSERAKSARLTEGLRVYVLATSGDWAEVEKDGSVGFMLTGDLTYANDDWTIGTPTPTPAPVPVDTAVVTSKSLPVYRKESTSSSKLGTLKKGQQVNLIRWNDRWAYIELDGNYGYCEIKGLAQGGEASESSASAGSAGAVKTEVTVTASKLTVYASQSKSSRKLGTLKQGVAVTLLNYNDGWAYIELGGNRGYAPVSGLSIDVDAALTTPEPTPVPSVEGAAKGKVVVSSLPVYRTASTKAEKLGTLKQGASVNVIKWNDEWAYIERDGMYGFCAVEGLSRSNAASTAPTPVPSLENAAEATVTDETVTVYRTASTASDVMGTLEWGDDVKVLSVSGGWAYIERSGNYGFCAASALTKAESVEVSAPSGYVKADFTATVISASAKAYQKASTSASSVSVSLGAEVQVAGYDTDLKWACVAADGKKAFMLIDDLNRGRYDTVTGTGAEAQTLLKALMTLGYYDGQATASAASDLAVTAIKRFQTACGLPDTGAADQTLQRILYGGHAPESDMLTMSLSVGSTGENVKRLQTRLYVLGYLSNAASLDGDYGNKTASAVGLFQQANGISASGTADGATLRAMYSASASGKPSSVKPADDSTAGTVIDLTGDDADSVGTGSVSSGGVVTPPSKVTLSSTYVTTMPASLKSTTSSYSSSMSKGQKLEHVIYSAQVKLGCTYVYGATGPNTFDCSGLTQYSFKKVGVSLKRSAYSQGYDSAYTKISGVSSLRRGDLVFFNTISDSDLSDHVGIYLGGGCFIHASSGGHKVVVSNLSSGYYNRVFSWGRRILG